MRHTKGPWVVEKTKHESWITCGDDFAICRINYEGYSELSDEDKANAHLISASPDLYELAKRIASLNKDAGEIGAGMLNQLVDQANNAIKKANGEL